VKSVETHLKQLEIPYTTVIVHPLYVVCLLRLLLISHSIHTLFHTLDASNKLTAY